MIVSGMWIQAAAIALIAITDSFGPWLAAAALLGIGTAMVYPTLLAAVGDIAHPTWRASAVGVYRLWRDAGFAVGAVLTGVVADIAGSVAAIWLVAAITLTSGVVVATRMQETHRPDQPTRRLPARPGIRHSSNRDLRAPPTTGRLRRRQRNAGLP
jgi:MFS family permease